MDKNKTEEKTKKFVIRMLKAGANSRVISECLQKWSEPKIRAIKAHITMGNI